MKIVKRKTAESFMKVMTALSVITGANGLSAIAVPQNPQVDIDAAVDGYALFVTNVAHAEDAGTEIPGSFAPPIAGSDIPTSDIPTSDIPTSDIPTSDIPTSDIPTSDIPTSDI
ncbi:MAG: hypothetical protein IIZ54_01375, partial [Selenomonadaceae bacterium]|nr:hypothetical protein [Selenomonadaceae bacterium]